MKVTVKHYLNKQVKPKIEHGHKYYALYVQIIANKTNFKMKSNYPFFDGYIQEIDMFSEFVENWIYKESESIKSLAAFFIENDKLDLLQTDQFKKYSRPLYEVITENFVLLFKKEYLKHNNNYPDVLNSLNYFDLTDILYNLETSIEMQFSEEYFLSFVGVKGIIDSMTDEKPYFKELNKITVFDFIFTEKRNIILESIKFWQGDIDLDYKWKNFKVDTPEFYKAIALELEKLIFDTFED